LSLLNHHLDKLLVFKTIAETGSFRKAATILRISQPALTRTVQILEQTVSGSLFERTRLGVELTQHGSELLALAEKIFNEVEKFDGQKSRQGRHLDEVRIGTYEYLVPILWSKALHTLSDRHDSLKLSINTSHAFYPHEYALKHQVDLIFDIEPVHHRDVDSLELFRDAFQFYGSPDISLLSSNPFGDIPLIVVLEAIDRNRFTLRNWLQKLNVTPPKLIKANTFTCCAQLAIEKVGATILPKSFGDYYVKQKLLKKLQIPAIPKSGFGDHSLYASVLSSRKERPEISLVLNHLKTVCSQRSAQLR
jgi:DNA-binding transcriptional LysR family regulator